MPENMSHQMMGYDRTSTMFSPDGRLLQVEYAKKTVRQGSTAIGIVFANGVLLVTDRRVNDKLIVAESVEKLFKVDDHIGAAVSGFISDGRVLIEKARVKAQQYRVTYDESIDVLELVKNISDMKQAFSQYGGARPFGVSILFAGIDDSGMKLYATEPSGIFFQYRATAIGEGELEIGKFLSEQYRDGMNLDEAFKLAIKCFKNVLGKDFDPVRLTAGYIDTTDRKFTKYDPNQIKKLAK